MKYFSIQELTSSNKATALGMPNEPGETEVRALTALIDKVLDPIREKWGKPITVNSGYRSKKLNSAVKGVPTSQHLKGEAADITAGSPELNKKLFEQIKSMEEKGEIEFDQLIWERGSKIGPAWIHISYKATGVNRHQTISIK